MAAYKVQPYDNTAAANTDVVINVPKINDDNRSIRAIYWSLSATPAAAIPLKVESPAGTVIFEWDITTSGPGYVDFADHGLPGADDQAMVVTLDLAANTGAIGHLNVLADIS